MTDQESISVDEPIKKLGRGRLRRPVESEHEDDLNITISSNLIILSDDLHISSQDDQKVV